jgi:predicted transcriptional regulator of viral defense system
MTMSPDALGLQRTAYAQDGLFTVAQAREHGISRQLLARHVRSGRYERLGRGLYKLRDFPGSSHEDLHAKWLSVGADRAVVSHESALELHGLGDVIPNFAHFLVARGDRWIRVPEGVMLHTKSGELGPGDVVIREGMRVTSPSRSILDAATAGTAPEQIELAVKEAIAQGLVNAESLIAQGNRRSRRVSQLVRRAVTDVMSG